MVEGQGYISPPYRKFSRPDMDSPTGNGSLFQMSIWYRRAWSTTIKTTVDGLVYALLTAGMFGWLWPR